MDVSFVPIPLSDINFLTSIREDKGVWGRGIENIKADMDPPENGV